MNIHSNYFYLNKIQNPQDLKKLKKEHLNILAQEIRQFLIENVLETGGHLGVNLGVIELIIALYYYFDFPFKDHLIFDVGHQAYVHKILTGRKDSFNSLKQMDGLSGYTNPSESIYDLFMFGHAGTGLSVASGIARVKKKINPNTNNKVIVVVGDASIASGISFEALNHLDDSLNNLIIILNDNGMSISKTVGNLSKYFASQRKTLKSSWINKIINFFKKKKDVFFEYFNLNYYGPIDGNNIDNILNLLNNFEYKKKRNKPILIHLITEKGKGYAKAKIDAEKCHAVKGKPKNNKKNTVKLKTYTEVFSKHIINMAQQDAKIIALTAAMASGTGLSEFKTQFPDRFFDCGIAEQHTVAMAAGMSFLGWKPICCIYSTFLQRAYDQIFQEVALNNKKILFIIDRAGIVGEDGPSHAGIYDIAYLKLFPNFILMAPKDALELRFMLSFALYNEHNGPVAIRWPKDYAQENLLNHSNDVFEKIQIGHFEIIEKGSDIIIIAYGSMVEKAYYVAQMLKKKNIFSYVINLRFAKPINEKKIIDILSLKLPVFIFEDHSILGGIYSSIVDIWINYSKNLSLFPIYSISVPDLWIKHGSRNDVLSFYNLDTHGISKFISEKLYKK